MRISRFAFTALICVLPGQTIHAQDSTPGMDHEDYIPGEYRVFSGDGQPATLDDIIAVMGDVEVVFIGEAHDDPTGHALEAELLQRAHETYGMGIAQADARRSIAASLEFFQHDAQPILNEYLAGLITESAFKAASRPWPRYESDYRDIVEYAKEHELSVVAANAPRRYANRVARLGREALFDLSDDALATLAPLPYASASRAYLDQWVMVMSSVMELEQMECGVPIVQESSDDAAASAHQRPMGNHGTQGSILDSQVLWDATMAYWISDHLVRNPGALVLHMVGSFHVARGTGTPEHLVRYRPSATSMIIVMQSVDDIEQFEGAPSGEWGDFVIQTDGSRTLEAIGCRGAQGG
jgi:uncharacterized iron-regulated protein